MIPTSGVRQLHYGNLCKIAAFSNSTKKCDALTWHYYQQVVLDNSTMKIYAKYMHNSNYGNLCKKLHLAILLRNVMIQVALVSSYVIIDV